MASRNEPFSQQRYLNDEAVQACPPSSLYRFSKFARRNRASLSAATLVAAALVTGTCISVWHAKQARDALFQAELAKGETEIAKKQIDLRYRIAKEAVGTYLLRVTQDERLDHPSFRQLRQSLLEEALPCGAPANRSNTTNMHWRCVNN